MSNEIAPHSAAASGAPGPHGWADVCAIDDIPPLGSRVVQSSGGDIAIFRAADDRIFAVHDKCPHKGGPPFAGHPARHQRDLSDARLEDRPAERGSRRARHRLYAPLRGSPRRPHGATAPRLSRGRSDGVPKPQRAAGRRSARPDHCHHGVGARTGRAAGKDSTSRCAWRQAALAPDTKASCGEAEPLQHPEFGEPVPATRNRPHIPDCP